MAAGKKWTRDELLVLMNVYDKIPFGQIDERQKVIRDLAAKMRRTPGSVAMKLCNLASFDPALMARGRKGLPGASQLDGQIWAEFRANYNELAPQSETAFRVLFDAQNADEVELVKGVGIRVRKAPEGPTETTAQVTLRRGQQFFRQMVLNAFDGQCAVTRIRVRELLVASHILPWKTHPSERLNAQNGLCLSRLHDAAFDRGLITFDEDYRLVMSKELRAHLPQESLQQNFSAYEGVALIIPAKALAPRPEYLALHRENIFRG